MNNIYDLSTFMQPVTPLHVIKYIYECNTKAYIHIDNNIYPKSDINNNYSINLSDLLKNQHEYIIIKYYLYETTNILSGYCTVKLEFESPTSVHHFYNRGLIQPLMLGYDNIRHVIGENQILHISSCSLNIIIYIYKSCSYQYYNNLYNYLFSIYTSINTNFRHIKLTTSTILLTMYTIHCDNFFDTSQLTKEIYIEDIKITVECAIFLYKKYKLYNKCYKYYLYQIIGINDTLTLCKFNKNNSFVEFNYVKYTSLINIITKKQRYESINFGCSSRIYTFYREIHSPSLMDLVTETFEYQQPLPNIYESTVSY
jgi:hypothetical protein